MARDPVVLVALGDDVPEPVLLAEARYWDALVRGEEPATADVDPAVVATITSVHQLDDTPLPRAAFARRLEETLLGADSLPASPRDPALPRGRPLPVASPIRQTSVLRRGMLGMLATAALVLLTLGVGYAALHLRAALPPPSAPRAAPRAGVTTLFTTTLPAEVMPDSGVLTFFFWRLALDPGTTTPMTPEGPCCRGPEVTHVLAGELTVHVDGPLQVFRGAGTVLADAAAPGADVVLLPGDTVIHDFSVPAKYANHGATPVQLVTGQLYAGTARTFWSSAMQQLDGSQEAHQAPLGAGPVAISLLRATLPPDGELPPPPPGSLLLEVGDDGDASVGKDATTNALFNINTQAETIYVIVVEPAGKPDLMP
jgi:hypothetical protein